MRGEEPDCGHQIDAVRALGGVVRLQPVSRGAAADGVRQVIQRDRVFALILKGRGGDEGQHEQAPFGCRPARHDGRVELRTPQPDAAIDAGELVAEPSTPGVGSRSWRVTSA